MSSLPEMCDRFTRWGLVFLIAFTPLAFGTVEPWSIAIMEWGIVTLVLIFWLGRLWPERSGSERDRGRLTGLEIPLGLFLLFCVLQTVPLPVPLLERISPGSSRMYAMQSPGLLYGSAGQAVPAPAHAEALAGPPGTVSRPVSVSPRETRSRIKLVAAFACLFLLTSWWGRRDRIAFLLGAVTIVGFVVALFGLVQFLTWNGKIYWVRNVPPTSAFGPFVNHNHFAGYVEMIIPVSIGLALYLIELRGRRQRGGVSLPLGMVDSLVRDGDDRGRWGRGALVLFAAVILLVSLFLSLSRGGILSTLVSGGILFVIVWRRIGSRWLAWSLALTLPVLALALILWIGPAVVARQMASYASLQSEASFRLRARIWENMIHEMPRYLWVGSGLGTFEESFAPFVPPGSPKRWDKAHNDYLQILWETGIVGCALFLAGMIVFVRRYWWPAFRSRVHPLDVLRMGVAVSLLSIALHSLIDFNLQIGANGFLCALLAGILVGLDRAVGREGPRASP